MRSLGHLLLLITTAGSLAGAAEPSFTLTVETKTRLKEAANLHSEYMQLRREGKTREAIPLAKQTLAIYKDILGEKHGYTIESLTHLGELYKASGDYAAARPYYEQLVAINKDVLGENHRDTAVSLNNLGGLLLEMRDLSAARSCWERALAINRKVLGERHPDTATSLDNLGSLLLLLEDPAAARPYLEQAQAIRSGVLGKEDADDSTLASDLTVEQKAQLDRAATLNRQVMQLYGQGQPKKAVPLAKQVLKIRRDILGDKHPDTAKSLNNLGTILIADKDYVGARPYLEEALEIHKEAMGEDDPTFAAYVHNLAGVLSLTGDYPAARTRYEQALAINERFFGEKHLRTATTLSDLGFLLHEMGDDKSARPYLERALDIRRELLGEKHTETVVVLRHLGNTLRAMGDYTAARPCLEEALEIDEETLGEKHLRTAMTLSDLGFLLHRMGNDKAARPYLERALAIRKEILGEKDLGTAGSLNSLGGLLRDMGEYAAAREYLEQALVITKEAVGDNAPATATSVNSIGALLMYLGQFTEAQSYLEQALAIRKATLGTTHPDTAITISNLAVVHQMMGDYMAAARLHKQALAIRREVLGEKHRDTANSLSNLGALFDTVMDYEAARPYYEEALEINKEVLGENHPNTALSLSRLGALHSSMGEYATARSYFDRALRGLKESLGEEHPSTATTLGNLGVMHELMGDFVAARQCYEQALAIRRQALGEKHPDTAHSLGALAALQAASGEWEHAAANYDQARRIARRHVTRVLPSLSVKLQLKFLEAQDMGGFYHSLSLGVLRAADPQLASLSAGWLLNGKAVAQEALTQRTLLARQSSDPAIGATLKELSELRSQLATLTLSTPEPGQEAARFNQLDELEQREVALSRHMAEANGDVFRTDPWVEVASVRRAMPADAVLVDISRFKVRNFEAKGQEEGWLQARYAAWLIPSASSQEEIRIMDLGEAEKIDQAVQEVRNVLQAALGRQGTISLQGEPKAEKLQQESLKQLAKLVLEPLVQEIGDAKEIVLSPDAALWLVPWGALPLADGRYAIEQYQIRYVVSGRDLVTEHATNVQTNKPIIMADPDYDLNPDKAESVTRAILGEPQPAQSDELRSFEPTASSTVLPKFTRLPYTAAEAQLISPKLESYTNETPILYTDQLALEGIFKAFRNQKVVVLSTHGYFLENQKAKPLDSMLASSETRGIALTVDGKPIENPLLRCGLLLAGCNRSDEARTTGAEDGVLTGMEIVGTDFRGTELVVLSACETGLGQVRNGEGVAGLRQAFQLAGAHAVVATLWQIPDRESARLMTTFFENLAAGQTKPDALRNAQLAMIQYRREKHAAAHPFFWAAFTITGE